MSAGAISLPAEDFYTSTSAVRAAEAEKNKGKSDVSSDAFMQLLVTQMTNQDPLEPMSNEQMMAQLAQLQTLEEQREMTDLVSEMTTEMKGMRGDNSTSLTNLINAINTNDQAVFVSLEAARLEGQISTASSLIGKDVTGTITDETGAESEFSGTATSVSITNGIAYLSFATGETMAVVDVKKVE
ncbi:MAG: flagellar hook assembly protein FlgD [Planctomycetota bacterium]|jgi:flagellar basal-body rod modification protein FlgD